MLNLHNHLHSYSHAHMSPGNLHCIKGPFALMLFRCFALLRLIHIGDFFKREVSDFLLAPIGTGISNGTFQIGDFPVVFSSENKNHLQTNRCLTHLSE